MDEVDYWHDHAAVSVPRLVDSVDWYSRVLGFVVEKRVTLESLQAQVAVLINAGNLIEFVERPRGLFGLAVL